MICSSLNRFRYMSVLPERPQLYYVRVSGEQVIGKTNTAVEAQVLRLSKLEQATTQSNG